MAYYAVKVGAKPGIYNTWEECSLQVTGYPGAKYKKFNNEEEALEYAGIIKKDGLSPEVLERVKTGLEGILDATSRQDKFDILSNVQDIAMLLKIEIEGISNPVTFMD